MTADLAPTPAPTGSNPTILNNEKEENPAEAQATMEPVEESAKPNNPEVAPEVPLVEATSTETPEPATSAIARPSGGSEKKVDFGGETTIFEPSTPMAKLLVELPAIIKEAGTNEMWGVELSNASHIPTTIVLEKFLRANNKDVAKARDQLTEALKWRKNINPRKLLTDVKFDSAKFEGLGYVTVYPKNETHEKEIVTWNIYGSVKDNSETFGKVEEFVRWRAALMELSVAELDLASATVPIPSDGVDPYRMVQVHDYMNVSFLRMDPKVKAASSETIQTFSMAYPELLKEKFFVNVPVVMGWVFAAMKLFLAPATIKKFHPLSYGKSLAGECKGWGEELPVAYGGKGKDVKEGLTVMYAPAETVETK